MAWLEGKLHMLFCIFNFQQYNNFAGSHYLLYTSMKIQAKFTLQLKQMINGILSIFQNQRKESTLLEKLKLYLLTVNTICNI